MCYWIPAFAGMTNNELIRGSLIMVEVLQSLNIVRDRLIAVFKRARLQTVENNTPRLKGHLKPEESRDYS
ncbi:MAG: hypothetical protein DRQ59_12045 [Gammaproteobacteria bacterium]|nr:MAG: hypothetical protein DRQ59_12045 [Gammaproteobacteria bacterium]